MEDQVIIIFYYYCHYYTNIYIMYDLEIVEVLTNILNEMIMASKYIISLFIEVLCDGSSIRPSGVAGAGGGCSCSIILDSKVAV